MSKPRFVARLGARSVVPVEPCMTLSFQLDRTSPVPLYHQLASQLEATIDDGRLAPGDQIENEIALADRLGLSPPPRLPSQLEATIDDGRLAPGDQIENEIALADRLGLSRPTVRRAIQDLVAKGLLVRQRGVGTQVASRMVHRRVELTSLHDDLARAGRSPRTEVLSFEPEVQDARACRALGLEPGTPLLFVERLRFAGREP